MVLGLCLAGCGASDEPTLQSRSLLDAKASAPAPFAAARDAEPKPAAGARQPVGGFSALLRAGGPHTFYALADNGFGDKANSHSFLLRVYRVRADDGAIRVLDWITLHDPSHKVPFRIVDEKAADRPLTGGDFDPESFRRDKAGTFWFGDEFGPYLLHTDKTGKVLEAPIPLPGVRSPDSTGTGRVNLPRSRGFEAMALSTDGKLLYPILEGAVAGDDPRARRLYAFDIARRAYAPGHRVYTVADAKNLVADADAIDAKRLAVLERDDFEGKKARVKQIVVADLPSGGVRLAETRGRRGRPARPRRPRRGVLARPPRRPRHRRALRHALHQHRVAGTPRRRPRRGRERHELRRSRAEPTAPRRHRPDRAASTRARARLRLERDPRLHHGAGAVDARDHEPAVERPDAVGEALEP